MTSGIQISPQLAVQDAPAAGDWYQRRSARTSSGATGGVVGPEIEGTPVILHGVHNLDP